MRENGGEGGTRALCVLLGGGGWGRGGERHWDSFRTNNNLIELDRAHTHTLKYQQQNKKKKQLSKQICISYLLQDFIN